MVQLAHMTPHSVTVHMGDRAKTGNKLGLLENGGNTTGPHLHFQISDRPSTLGTTALPFVFETMVEEGRMVANLEEIREHSMKGVLLKVESKGERRGSKTGQRARNDVVRGRIELQ